jgi:hypothetical protein
LHARDHARPERVELLLVHRLAIGVNRGLSASLTLVGHREALVFPVRLGVERRGVRGHRVDTSPALVPQLTTTLGAGIYCINISDIGALPGAAAFSVRFVHW